MMRPDQLLSDRDAERLALTAAIHGADWLEARHTISLDKAVEIPQFSERAVLEAIVNAVAHRDCFLYGSKNRPFMFDDRLELYSPGALPNTVTIESLALRQVTRNELVTSLLARCPVEPDDPSVGRQFPVRKRGDTSSAPAWRMFTGPPLLQ